ncbi:MAG: hypothetical protein ABJD07_01515 [Gemmatimonadaceae bacterium]
MPANAGSLALAAVMSLAIGSCSHGATLAPLPPGGHHVLFVGNSLTYVNDLPSTVAAIAAAAGDTFRVATAAGPDLALIDHLNGATNAVALIKSGPWEFVVLQQGPTTIRACRDSLILWTRMFDPIIRAAGAKTALFMTWPAPVSPGSFDDVRTSFRYAAGSVGGIFLPAGDALRLAMAADNTIALYGPDGFHPSVVGTYLAALEIYERLSGRDVRTLPARAFAGSAALSLPESTIRLLQRAAHEANATNPANPPPPPPNEDPAPPPPGGRC